MSRITALLVGITALTVVSTVAEAADGCGRGWYYNGRRCVGRKSHAERNPDLVAVAKRLHRQRPKGGRMSLRAISTELATQGFLNENGRPFAAASVRSMLD